MSDNLGIATVKDIIRLAVIAYQEPCGPHHTQSLLTLCSDITYLSQ